MDKRYRHEWKHQINVSDMIAVRQRMRAIARPDPHAEDGRYLIRSLYFDNLDDKALRDMYSLKPLTGTASSRNLMIFCLRAAGA